MKAREQKESHNSVNMKSSKKDRTSRNTYKRIEFMVTKGTRAVYKTRRCERILSCKSEANGCTSEVKTKKTRKELEKTKVERVKEEYSVEFSIQANKK